MYNYIQLYTCRSTGCFTSCFLIGAMRWLSCKSAAKEVHLQIWQTNETFLASQYEMLPFRWLEGSFKLKAFPAPSLPTYGSASGFSQCFSGNGVCCKNCNCLTALNEMSIFQDFAWSIDWVTLQQPRQIRQRLWFPQRLLIFDWWQLAQRRLQVDGTPRRQSLSNWLLQTGIALIWTGPPSALCALRPRSTNRLDMVPPSPLINFVIAQGSILQTKSVYKMTRPHAYFVYGMMCPQVWQGHSWSLAYLFRTFASSLRGLLQRYFWDGGVS